MIPLRDGAMQLGIELSDAQIKQFEQYMRLLLQWNQQVNLTAITAPDEVVTKHFLDSLSCLKALESAGVETSAKKKIIDIGSGGGFPGIPLKIVRPGWQVALLETKRKKALFLRTLAAELGLEEVLVIVERAEIAARLPEHREAYDIALARAVAQMSTLAEYTLPYVRRGGLVLAQKGEEPADEYRRAQTAVETLGGRLKGIIPMAIPGLPAARHIVILEKIAPTPPDYPRRPGLPEKRPL
jgi:16S rRNA (guanine527-N7)-methyltransferase